MRCFQVLSHSRERTAKSGCATQSATWRTGRTAACQQSGRPLPLQFPPSCGCFGEAAPSCLFRGGAGNFVFQITNDYPFSIFDLARAGVLTCACLGRGAEAISSWAGVPRGFGGLGERGSRIFRRSFPRQRRRGGWGARLRPAHCHPGESDGALSRSEALQIVRGAGLPLCALFLPWIGPSSGK